MIDMPPRVQVAAATRQARAARRAELGPLLHLRVKATTLCKYQTAVHDFLSWLLSKEKEVALTIPAIDEQVAEYLEFLWETRAGRNAAGAALSGIQFALRKRRCVPMGWELLRVWQRVEPPRRAPPLPEQLLKAM